MKFIYVAKQFKITEGLKDAIESKISRCDKYLVGEKEAKVVLSHLKGINRIEVTINTKNFTVRAEESHEDMYAAIDIITDKLERKLRKNKEKMYRKNNGTIRYVSNEEPVVVEDSCVLRRKKIGVKPMSEEEAILQMDLLGHDFYMFKDISNIVKIVYKRKDGNYGVIESV